MATGLGAISWNWCITWITCIDSKPFTYYMCHITATHHMFIYISHCAYLYVWLSHVLFRSLSTSTHLPCYNPYKCLEYTLVLSLFSSQSSLKTKPLRQCWEEPHIPVNVTCIWEAWDGTRQTNWLSSIQVLNWGIQVARCFLVLSLAGIHFSNNFLV